MRSPRLQGIAAMLVAVAAFAAMDAVLKVLAGRYPPLQVTALRGASSLPFVLAAIAWAGAARELWPKRPVLHLVRGLLGVVMIAAFATALRTLSLADAYAVFFVSPLLVTAFAVPLLGERVEWQRWAAILVGLLGVLVILRPSSRGLASVGAAAALLSAVTYALSAIMVRALSRQDSTRTLIWTFLLVLTAVSALLAAPDWVPIRARDWPWILALGVIGTVAQHFITEAFRHAPASVIAPFEYTALLWAVVIDWTFWQVLPEGRALLGGGIVICAGLYLIWRERRLHKELAASVESPASLH
jgi:drug/metabolite transporter (DMT)-like permease